MRDRHNKLLSLLLTFVPPDRGQIYREQKPSGSTLDLRPDVLVINSSLRLAIMVDVAVPFASPASFSEVRKGKIEKYTPLARWLEQEKELRSSVHAFLVGSLGSWDPDNKGALDALKVPAESRRRLKRRCAAETLQGSNNIWRARR
jgi:hypothetical protein